MTATSGAYHSTHAKHLPYIASPTISPTSIPIMTHSINHFSPHTVFSTFCLFKNINLPRHFVIYGSSPHQLSGRYYNSFCSFSILQVLSSHTQAIPRASNNRKPNHSLDQPYLYTHSVIFLTFSLILWSHLLPFITSFLAISAYSSYIAFWAIVFDISNSTGPN